MKSILSSLLVIVLLFSISQISYAADKMTYEDYQSQLKIFQDREQKALQEIALEKQKIEDIRRQISEIDAKIASIWNEIYASLGVSEEEYNAFLQQIAELEGQVSSLERLTPDQLLSHAQEIDQLKAQVDGLLTNPIALLKEVNNKLVALARRIDRLKESLPKPKNDIYAVMRGDYLWKISGKKQIFGDPWKWMRIYSVNRDQIRNPDLIYPDQRLNIPRQIGRDQHLVAKGEFLSKIAGYREVYGDPFKWTKIYQANKSNGFIQDPNLIYPEQILTIPQN